MIEVEVDGRKVEVPEGSMLMEAANRLGIYVPHFCYHKKLTIAANCRMCLVEVEKAPKPLPACATPVAKGMVVRTQSAYAKQAQNSVMEFLLINHPLDCPICDQGGECQLQDLLSDRAFGQSVREPSVSGSARAGSLILPRNDSLHSLHTRRSFGGGCLLRSRHGKPCWAREILSFVGNSVDSELSAMIACARRPA